MAAAWCVGATGPQRGPRVAEERGGASMARRGVVDQFTLPSELLGEAGSEGAATSLNPPPKTSYELWAQCEENNTLRRRLRSQEDPGCRFSYAIKAPGVPRPRDAAAPSGAGDADGGERGLHEKPPDSARSEKPEKSMGQALFSNIKRGARFVTGMSPSAKGGRKDDGRRDIPKGYRDVAVSVVYYPLSAEGDVGADESAIPEDSVYTVVSNTARYRQDQTVGVIAVSDLWERGCGNTSPLVQIVFSTPILSHCLSPQLDLAVGLLTGEVLVFNLTAGFVYRADPPAVHRDGHASRSSKRCQIHEDVGCTAVAFTSNPHRLISGHMNGSLHVHNISRGDVVGVTTPGTAALTSPVSVSASSPGFSFSRRGSDSALGGSGLSQSSTTHTPRTFSSRKGSTSQAHAASVMDARIASAAILDLAVSPGGDGSIAAACEDGDCIVVSDSTLQTLFSVRTKFGAAMCCSWSACGKYLAVGGQDDLVALYAVLPLTMLAYLSGACNWISAICVEEVKANGTLLVVATSLDGKVYLWEVEGGLAADLTSPTLSLSQIRVGGDAPQPTTLQAPKWDAMFMVPEIDAVTVLSRLHHCLPLHGLALFPQYGHTFATVCGAGILKVWSRKANADDVASPAQCQYEEAAPPPQLQVANRSGSSGANARPVR